MIHNLLGVSFVVQNLMEGGDLYLLFCKIVYIIYNLYANRKNDLILIMTPEKQDKTLELSKHWSPDSTPARNKVIMKTTYVANQ